MTVSLSDFIVPEAVTLGMDAADAADVIRNIGDKLLRAGYVRETFTAAALERERTIPTGLPLSGDINAAIPHTDAEHVLKPGVGLATLIRPVTFQNMVSPQEAVSVQLVFVLALEQPKSQVEMLQEIARVLQKPGVVNLLVQATDMDQVSEALRGTVPQKS